MLSPGKNLTLVVSLARDGKPVTDLEPFLGAMGHLIIVSADRDKAEAIVAGMQERLAEGDTA